MPRVALDSKIRDDLSSWAAKLKSEDKLLGERQLAGYLDTFRERFGPDQLAKIDGTELLKECTTKATRRALSIGLSSRTTMTSLTRVSAASPAEVR